MTIDIVLVPPNRNQGSEEFSTTADTFVADLVTLATQINTTQAEINATQVDAQANQTAAEAAQTAAELAETGSVSAQTASETARDESVVAKDLAEAAVATLPEGTINDLLIEPDKAWSSEKISAELDLVTPVANKIIFTSSGSFTVPTGITRIKVYLWGGGGSGGVKTNLGSGGAGGGYSEKTITTTGGTVYSVTIGSGGAGVTDPSTNTNGNDGGTTSFGSECSATGGGGANVTNYDNVGGDGVGVNGDVNISGAIGYGTSAISIGGGSPNGGPTQVGPRKASGQNVSGIFPGGGGFGNNTGPAYVSGAGADGLCIVEY